MAARNDLLLDANGDLPIGATLMTTGPSDDQHQKDMIASFPGEWKQFRNNGVGVARYLKSTGNALLVLKNKIRQALKADGYTPGTIQFSYTQDNVLVIKTNATR